MPEITLPIRTGRLTLRRFEAADLDAFHAYHSLPETARFLLGPAKSYTKSMESVGKYANFVFEKEGDWLALAIEAAGTPGLLGEVVLKWLPGPGQAEIGWSLSPEARGRGIATEVVYALLADEWLARAARDGGYPRPRRPLTSRPLTSRPPLEDQVPVDLRENVAVHHPGRTALLPRGHLGDGGHGPVVGVELGEHHG
jgi:hypothetical protein